MRTVDEWIGATDNARIPTRVRLRVWERDGGKCALTGRKIRPGEPWQLDHRVSLINGGQHREQNLQVVSVEAHKAKTADDVAIKSKISRVKAKHLGQWPKSKARLQGRAFQKSRPEAPHDQ